MGTANQHRLLLVSAAVLCLLPFLGKAFHIDDPLFLWAGQHIQADPWNFYAFDVNWYGLVRPMSQVMKNPPLTAYYIALAANVLGWSERGLHLAFLIPAGIAVIGVYRLTGLFCARPFLATLIAIVTPAFLVSATTVMSDIPMLAFWVWALALWVEGMDENSLAKIALAAFLASLAVLTKYSALFLFPLLVAYAVYRKRFRLATLGMSIPLVTLILYQYATYCMYGHGLLLDSVNYVPTGERHYWASALSGVTFLGGGLLAGLVWAPVLWTRRQWIQRACALFLFGGVLLLWNSFPYFPFRTEMGIRWPILFQVSLFLLAGLELILWSTQEWFFAVWLFSILAFTCLFNWAVNCRSILPLAPLAGILITKQLGDFKRIWIPFALQVALSLWVTFADFNIANLDKVAAERLKHELREEVHPVWFQGHWGFQYYMQKLGFLPIDFSDVAKIRRGTWVITPIPNTNTQELPPDRFHLVGRIQLPLEGRLTTNDWRVGSGFYSNAFGPLPFVVGYAPAHEFILEQCTRN